MAEDPPVIREATPADGIEVARLMTEFGRAVGPSGFLRATPERIVVTPGAAVARMQAMAETETVLLAETGGRAVGLASVRVVRYLSQDVPYAEVTGLYVEEAPRRSGIGRMLMLAAEALARSRGATALRVLAWHENEDALAFYRAIGYDGLYVGFEKYFQG